jgi:hypothetical protein
VRSGIAIEDIASAHYVYTQAIAQGLDISVPHGPDREVDR